MLKILRFTFDPAGDDVYKQIVDQFVDHVVVGKLIPGDSLETIVEFEQRHRLSHGTVARVYLHLHERGIIGTARKQGSFIADISPALAGQLRMEYAQRHFGRHMAKVVRESGITRSELEQAVKRSMDQVFAGFPTTPQPKTSTSNGAKKPATKKVSRQ